jgi:putative ABC transport system permease protein
MSPLTFWNRFTLRHARRDLLQTGLLLLILGLGVGTFLSIRIANRAAVAGFALFTESLSGPTDWIVETPGSTLSAEELTEVRGDLGEIRAELYPVIEQTLTLPQVEGGLPQSVRLLGLDLVQLRLGGSSPIPQGESWIDEQIEDFWELLDNPRHLFLAAEAVERMGLQVGEPVVLIANGEPLEFTLSAILPEFQDTIPVPANLAIVDIATALDRLGLDGVDRLEVRLPESDQRDALVAMAGERLAAAASNQRWLVKSANEEAGEGATMTAAFRLNLTVLSLVALFVGLCLIAQTLDATVSRRRREIASLRSLGLTGRDIYRLWLSEAILYSIVAAGVGSIVGTVMARFTVEAVTTTVRTLYRETAQTSAVVTSGDIILCLFISLVGGLLAAWLPARDAASTPPAQFLRLAKRIPPFPLFQHPWIGGLALVAATLLAFLPPVRTASLETIPLAGYAAAFLFLTGGTLVAVKLLEWGGKGLASCHLGSPTLRLALSRLAQPTSRHQLALAGFFVAIGMAASMAFLIQSFETTVTGWLKQRLNADIFISSIGFQGADSDQRISRATLDAIETLPSVKALDRFTSVRIDLQGTPALLGGSRFELIGAEQETLWIEKPRLSGPELAGAATMALANESIVRRLNLSVGDVVSFVTPAGERTVTIAGVFADYGNDNGLIAVDIAQLENWFGLNQYQTAALYLAEGSSRAQVQADLKERYPGLEIRDNAELMTVALGVFNQTFAVTYALQFIALIVALGGLVLSTLSLLRESVQEIALQRTLGMTRHEISMTTAVEGAGVALVGLISGLLLSTALGLLLIYVINRQSFGWTLQLAYPWTTLVGLSLAVILLSTTTAYLTGRLFLRNWHLEPQ